MNTISRIGIGTAVALGVLGGDQSNAVTAPERAARLENILQPAAQKAGMIVVDRARHDRQASIGVLDRHNDKTEVVFDTGVPCGQLVCKFEVVVDATGITPGDYPTLLKRGKVESISIIQLAPGSQGGKVEEVSIVAPGAPNYDPRGEWTGGDGLLSNIMIPGYKFPETANAADVSSAFALAQQVADKTEALTTLAFH